MILDVDCVAIILLMKHKSIIGPMPHILPEDQIVLFSNKFLSHMVRLSAFGASLSFGTIDGF